MLNIHLGVKHPGLDVSPLAGPGVKHPFATTGKWAKRPVTESVYVEL